MQFATYYIHLFLPGLFVMIEQRPVIWTNPFREHMLGAQVLIFIGNRFFDQISSQCMERGGIAALCLF